MKRVQSVKTIQTALSFVYNVNAVKVESNLNLNAKQRGNLHVFVILIGSVESEEQCQTPPTPSKLHRHCETTQKARSPRRPPLLEKAWGKLQSLCSINAAPGRTSGYYRIHPKTATRLYCDMMDEKEESFVEIAELPSEVTTGEKPLRMKCDDSANGVAEFTIDKILLCLCALIITIGYPIAIFFVLSE